MNLIVNAAQDWAIGKNNELLFHLKQDMQQQFRPHTLGNVVVMGRKTLDSFPDGKPLPKRTNIVLSRNPDFQRDGCIVCHSIAELDEELNKYDDDSIYIIGGDSIYRTMLDRCSKAFVTRVYASKDGADAFMINLDESSEWEITDESEMMTENGIDFKFVTYTRK